jgi:hypothetical protein
MWISIKITARQAEVKKHTSMRESDFEFGFHYSDSLALDSDYSSGLETPD